MTDTVITGAKVVRPDTGTVDEVDSAITDGSISQMVPGQPWDMTSASGAGPRPRWWTKCTSWPSIVVV